MKRSSQILISGAGGIARAAALMLSESSKISPNIYIGNRTVSNARSAVKWVKAGCSRKVNIQAVHIPEEGISGELKELLPRIDLLLDCLPGSQAPRMARLARDFRLHYVNLTEYVAETNEIMEIARDAETGFVLQSGIAPGYIDILAHGLYLDFCKDFGTETVDKLELKVGALTNHAVGPHYYGFTWSPVGVATEYCKDASVLRDYRKDTLPSLSEKARLVIDGITYEDNLTSGGVADLPDALAGKVRTLDYKTIRHPGHYDWVQRQLAELKDRPDPVSALQERMEEVIPHVEDDFIILYAAVEGKDATGTLRRREIAKKIFPQKVGHHTIRAIQATTASPMLQAAAVLLETSRSGLILQSQLDPQEFLQGDFIVSVYGKP